MGRGDPPHDVVVHVPAHQEQVGGGQHRERDAGAGQALRRGGEARRIGGRELGDVADRDPAAVAETVRQRADVVEVQRLGVGPEIQVHVDVDVELPRHLEDAVDLAVGVAVRIRRRADHRAALSERLDHELVGARVVEQPFLRKDADLDVDGPLVLLDQGQHAFEAPQADDRVDLQLGAHVGGAVQDAFLERLLPALVDVLRRERLLDPGDLADGLLQIAALRSAAIEDAGLVQMDMGLDEARGDQPAAGVDLLAPGREAGLDGGDAAALDADVHRGPIRTVIDPGVAQDSVHVLLPSPCPYRPSIP